MVMEETATTTIIPREKQTSRRWRKLTMRKDEQEYSFVMEASSTSSMQNNPRFLSIKQLPKTNGFSSMAATGSEKAKEVVDMNNADLWMASVHSTDAFRC